MFTAIRPPESTAERHGSAARIAVHSEPSFGGHPSKDMHPNNDDLTTRLRKKLATERRRRLSIQNKLSSAETKARDLEARLSMARNQHRRPPRGDEASSHAAGDQEVLSSRPAREHGHGKRLHRGLRDRKRCIRALLTRTDIAGGHICFCGEGLAGTVLP